MFKFIEFKQSFDAAVVYFKNVSNSEQDATAKLADFFDKLWAAYDQSRD